MTGDSTVSVMRARDADIGVFSPKEVFLTNSVGIHKYRLSSFESALRDAGIANQNIVPVSSILPPGCKVISKKDGIGKLAPGTLR